MVDVVATNAKLRGRVVRILREASGAEEAEARAALEATGGELKPALVSLLADVDAAAAHRALAASDGSVARALTVVHRAPAVTETTDSTTDGGTTPTLRALAHVPTGDPA
jgi:N-acetylmuramic acid 6-phosphate etherase